TSCRRRRRSRAAPRRGRATADAPRRARRQGGSADDRGGASELEDESAPRLVVAAVRAEEAFARARKLLAAVVGERPAALVPYAAAALLRQLPCGIARQRFGVAARAGVELIRGLAQGRVEEPDCHCAACAQRFERRRRELSGQFRAYAPRQQVGPVLRAIETAHVP